MEGMYDPAFDWIHVPDSDCWTGCDFCQDLEYMDSPLTWAVGKEKDLVIFADLYLTKEPVNLYPDIATASKMLLRLVEAVKARNHNSGKEPCESALDSTNPCSCCGRFRTSANVIWLLVGEDNLSQLAEDIQRIRMFATKSLREALLEALPEPWHSLPWHILDIILEHMDSSFYPFFRGLYREEQSNTDDWSFVSCKEEDEENLRILYTELSKIYIAIRNNLFVNPAKVPTTSVSDLFTIRKSWAAMISCIEPSKLTVVCPCQGF